MNLREETFSLHIHYFAPVVIFVILTSVLNLWEIKVKQ